VGLLRRHPVLSALLFLLLAASLLVLVTGIAVWRAAHIDAASRIEHADAIIVLGAAEYDGAPSPVFAGRLEHAVLLFNEDRASTVLVLGGSRPGDVSTEAQAGANFLISAGLPSSGVVPIPRGSTTLESLRAAAGYMRAHDLGSAFLVSDPWHNLRIQRMASDLGIEGYPSATWHSAARSEETRLGGYIRETFAYLYYRILGR
jgi:uncharacterized SAM-binding protein YcdF (DUF218 family)